VTEAVNVTKYMSYHMTSPSAVAAISITRVTDAVHANSTAQVMNE